MEQHPPITSRPSPLLLAEAWLTLLWVRFILRIRPKSTLRNALKHRGRPWLRRAGNDPDAIGAAVKTFARTHVVPMTCLVRSIAIKRMLERRALSPDLRVGFQRADKRLLGHAWVELAGGIIGDDPNVTTRFGLHPSDEAWMGADSHDGSIWWFDDDR